MNIPTDPFFYAAAIPAMMIFGVSKGGFGGALGVLAVPLIALVIPPVQAAAIMLPILCAMDLFALYAYRRVASWQNLKMMLPGAILGIGIGGFAFGQLDENVVRILLGVIAVAFTLNHWFGRKPHPDGAKPGLIKGSSWGALAGFTSTIAHAGGPPVQFYLLPQKMDKTLYVGTTVWFFIAVNYAKLIPYGLAGQLSLHNLETSLVLLPLAPLGIWLGVKAHHHVPELWFYRVAYVMLFVTGGKLLWDGVQGLIG